MEERAHPNGLVTWSFDLAAATGTVAAVTTRVGGVSAAPYDGCNLGDHVGDDPASVAANRAAVAEALGVPAPAIGEQSHGRRVAVVTRDTGLEDLRGTDALVTTDPAVAVAVLVADCAPVVLVDPVRRAVAVAHAGRKGVVLDVVGATVAALGEVAGSEPADLHAGVGPCIGPAAYEISDEALAEVEAAFDGAHLTPSPNPGRAHFDLLAAVLARLRAAGVGRIELAGATTDGRPDRFFSDRAARPCGRFGLVAALR